MPVLPPPAPPANGPYLGPCLFNNPTIILSHWDWDYWRLAKIAHDQGAHGGVDVINLSWIFPLQPIGPATANFRDSLTQPTQWPGGLASMPIADGLIVRCTGPAIDINNSGLAIILPMLLPSTDPNVHVVIFTGDVSFGNVPVPAPMLALSTGITAVHHGSDSHGAALNLPNPPAPYNVTGGMAYSYGVYQRADRTFFHAYGHPRVPAINTYQAVGFRNEACTAESAFFQDDGVRGNVRMGQFIAFRCLPNSCAFQAFPPAKRLD
ncbi:MAG TPA: hypothetical protein VMS31_22795 [Pyrinomonadaceae bacterium]|nr:hypothetical protein [Pyrinomonadaceae bacterium]